MLPKSNIYLRIVLIYIFFVNFSSFLLLHLWVDEIDHPISFVFAATSDKIEPTISIKLKIKGSETAQVNFDTVPSSM